MTPSPHAGMPTAVSKLPSRVLATLSMLRAAGIRGRVTRVLAAAYRRMLRRISPVGEPVRYAGVAIARDRRWTDAWAPASWVPSELADEPEYEATLIAELRRSVREGDRVVVVGGGWGVTAVVAARLAGAGGRVRCYEGGAEFVDLARSAAARNGVAGVVTVEHAVVGRAVHVYGNAVAGAIVHPSALPACDVLQLDCEGAEVEIFEHLTIRPRTIIAETHGLYGAPTSRVVAQLERMGYHVDVVDVAEPRMRAFCAENDIMIVTGVRTPEDRVRATS